MTNVPSNQTNAFRGRIVFPKEPRIKGETVLVFAEQGTEAAAAAHRAAEQLQASGSSTQLIIGGSEMITDAASGRVPAYTRVLCTTAMLPPLSKALARTLGPRGLMPSVKRGTAVEDGEEMQRAVEQLVTGVDWRGDRAGVVRGAVGRIAFSEADLRKNVQALLDAVIEKAVSGLAGTKTSAHVVAGYARDTEAVDAQGQKVAKRTPGALKRGMYAYELTYSSIVGGATGAPELDAGPGAASALGRRIVNVAPALHSLPFFAQFLPGRPRVQRPMPAAGLDKGARNPLCAQAPTLRLTLAQHMGHAYVALTQRTNCMPARSVNASPHASMKSPTALGVFLAGAATVLLGFVTFCTPVFEKLWLLEATLPQGKAQFGVLGYKVRDVVTSMHLGYPRRTCLWLTQNFRRSTPTRSLRRSTRSLMSLFCSRSVRCTAPF